jgi:hypothetical protein
MKMLEKCCRKICEEKELEADKLVCPLIPVFINATPLINGFELPPREAICKMWELFVPYVKVAFTAANVEDVLDDEVGN